MKKGISWTTLEPPASTKQSAWFNLAPPREKEIIACAAAMHGEDLVYVDTNPSIERASMSSEDMMCTITTGSKYYLKRHERFMTGRECLGVQGFPFSFLQPGSDLSDPQLGDLAGNAFSSTVCCAVLLGCFAHVPELVEQHVPENTGEDVLHGIHAMLMME